MSDEYRPVVRRVRGEWRTGLIGALASFALCVGFVDASDGHRAVVPHAASAVVVAQSRRGPERVALAAGRMTYSDAVDNEGYLPAHSIAVVAERRSRAFDYAAGLTAFQLGDRAELALRERGYRIAFRCARAACGDSDGWRLFLGDALAGSEGSQHYLLAWREIDARTREYAQYYVADLHGRARLLLNTFVGQPLAERGVDSLQPPLYFSPGSAELSLQARETLRDWVDAAGLVAGSTIEVTGYADPQGVPARNQTLSQQRAVVVARWLEAEAALAGIRVVTVVGGVDAQAGQAGQHPLADGRRVEMRVIRGEKTVESDKVALGRSD